ncbi:MAG: hypothetical protein RMJ89_01100 [Flammeovirgaceae bacterium]|nr:hypothetical protein [Flammeovirgaceae bacterium]
MKEVFLQYDFSQIPYHPQQANCKGFYHPCSKTLEFTRLAAYFQLLVLTF